MESFMVFVSKKKFTTWLLVGSAFCAMPAFADDAVKEAPTKILSMGSAGVGVTSSRTDDDTNKTWGSVVTAHAATVRQDKVQYVTAEAQGYAGAAVSNTHGDNALVGTGNIQGRVAIGVAPDLNTSRATPYMGVGLATEAGGTTDPHYDNGHFSGSLFWETGAAVNLGKNSTWMFGPTALFQSEYGPNRGDGGAIGLRSQVIIDKSLFAHLQGLSYLPNTGEEGNKRASVKGGVQFKLPKTGVALGADIQATWLADNQSKGLLDTHSSSPTRIVEVTGYAGGAF
jgi:hypothetical protein